MIGCWASWWADPMLCVQAPPLTPPWLWTQGPHKVVVSSLSRTPNSSWLHHAQFNTVGSSEEDKSNTGIIPRLQPNFKKTKEVRLCTLPHPVNSASLLWFLSLPLQWRPDLDSPHRRHPEDRKTAALFFLHRLKCLKMDSGIFCDIYRCHPSRVSWPAASPAGKGICPSLLCKALWRVVKTTQHITGTELASMEDRSLHPVVEEEGQQNYKGPPSPQPQTIPPVDGAAATGLS